MSAAEPDRPSQRAPAVPWSWLEALAILVLVLALGVFVPLPLVAVGRGLGLEDAALRNLLIPLSPLLLLAVALAVLRLRHPGGLGSVLGWRRWRWRDAAWGLATAVVGYVAFSLVIGGALQIAVRAAGLEVPEVQEGFRQAAADPDAVWLLALSAIVLAPVAEEVVYRGVLFQALRDRFGVGVGVWGSAVVFAGMHVEPAGPWIGSVLLVGVILPLGALLAWVFHRRGSLLVPIVAHAAFNSVSVLLLGLGA